MARSPRLCTTVVVVDADLPERAGGDAPLAYLLRPVGDEAVGSHL